MNIKKLIISIVIVFCVLAAAYIIMNVKTNEEHIAPSPMTPQEKPSRKIVAPEVITATTSDSTYTAPNESEKPALVVAKKGDEVIWTNQVSTPNIDPNKERDVQLLNYFVTKMRVDEFKSQQALYVTLGTGSSTRLFILDLNDGHVLNIVRVNPSPVQ